MGIFSTLRNVIDNIEDAVNRVEITIKTPEQISTPPVPAPTPKSGLSLVKGQRITLEKNGQNLTNVCVGVNWGMIGREAVDLDVSAVTYSGKHKDDVVYYGKLSGQGIKHSGDDLTGDDTQDFLDNEIISLALNNIKPEVDKIFIVLNSYRGHQFDRIPYATIRIYEGTPSRVDNVIATYNVANDASFHGKVTMVLGNLYRHSTGWKFNAIGEPTTDSTLAQTTETISQKYI